MMQQVLSKLYPYIRPYLGLIAVIFIYVSIERHIPYAFGRASSAFFRVEIPILCFIFSFFYYIQNNNNKRFWIAVLPVLLIYLTFSIYFIFFNQLLRFEDIANTYEMLDVISTWQLIQLLLLFGMPVTLLLWNIKYSLRTLVIIFTYLCLISLAAYAVNNFATSTQKVLHNVVKLNPWEDTQSVRQNGRITSALLHTLKSKSLQARFMHSKKGYSKFIADKSVNFNHKNIYILVLESWLDPRRLSNVKFNINPAHPSWIRLIGANKPTIVTSSTTGGGTARSEFEILCGLPSLMLLGTVEWNNFDGSQETYCLPHILKQQGYATSGAHPYKRNFYNSKKAYDSLGFNNTYFGKLSLADHEKNSFITDDAIKDVLFDGSFLQQHLKFINRDSSNTTGNLHYALGMYGHALFDRNLTKRPDVITVTPSTENLHNITNQFYYRTGAVADYINQILLKDKDSLIIVTSDHLPGYVDYQKHGLISDGIGDNIYQNTAYIFQDGEYKQYPDMYMFELNQIILEFATDNQYCTVMSCKEIGTPYNKDDYVNDYLAILKIAQ